MKKNKTLKKCLITTIATAAISITAFFTTSNVSLAYGTWQGNATSGMPQLSYSDSGLFPQILKQRAFSGNADNQFPYEAWTTDMSTGTVYCNDAGKAVRYGEFDSEKHYIDEIGYTTSNGYGYSAFERKVKQYLWQVAKEDADRAGRTFLFAVCSNIHYEQKYGPGTQGSEKWAIEKDKPMISVRYGAIVAVNQNLAIMSAQSKARSKSKELMKELLSKLGDWKTPKDTDDDTTNPANKQKDWNGDAIYGPEVVIMETQDRAEDHYKQVGSTEATTNTQLSFVLTTMENAYSGTTGSIRNRYSLSDIQTAHWKVADLDGIIPNGNHLTSNGLTLYNKALSYQKFLDTYINGSGYKAQVHGIKSDSYSSGTKTGKQDEENTNSVTEDPQAEAQVIVNQATKSYIVGPLSVTYPYYEDISYMKAIYLVTDKGTDNEKTLVYDENTDDFEIEFIGATVSGSNGLKKKYPASNAKFYVKFSAEKTNYPKTVNMYVDLEYLEKSTVKFNILDTKANVYQYIGYVATTSYSKYRLREGYGMGTVRYAYERKTLFGSYVAYKKLTVNYLSSSKGVMVVQPFVQMTEYPVRSLRAQQLRVALEGSRTYNIYTATVSAKPDSKKPDKPDTPDIDIPINLTFELGGRVWVDGTVGKENDYDGLFNKQTDTPMSNVKVSLYQVSGLDGNQSGKFIAATTTDDNGEYLFQKQNAMYQYYVKFTYNGQYYQPTVYNVNRQDSNWDNTSKGLDILKERDTFNASFREIGSAPKNTVTTNNPSEMHTRDELEEAGTIDKFGNIKGEVSSNGERKSKDEYVNQSMMDAYTCNGTSTKDLYPGFQVFVTEDFLNANSNTAQVLKFVAAQKIETL